MVFSKIHCSLKDERFEPNDHLNFQIAKQPHLLCKTLTRVQSMTQALFLNFESSEIQLLFLWWIKIQETICLYTEKYKFQSESEFSLYTI